MLYTPASDMLKPEQAALIALSLVSLKPCPLALTVNMMAIMSKINLGMTFSARKTFTFTQMAAAFAMFALHYQAAALFFYGIH